MLMEIMLTILFQHANTDLWEKIIQHSIHMVL